MTADSFKIQLGGYGRTLSGTLMYDLGNKSRKMNEFVRESTTSVEVCLSLFRLL